MSLDVLRGFAVAGMIVVNNPGDWGAVFPPLLHAYWTGLTAADLVFPAFIFAMGVAMSRLRAGPCRAAFSTGEIYKHIGRRVVLLIAIGLALNVVSAWPEISPLRLPGVLQTHRARLPLRQRRRAARASFTMAVGSRRPAGCPLGFPGPRAVWRSPWPVQMTPDHNLARSLDTLVFGRHALTIPIDPEGLLGTLTASATAVFGAAAGDWIRRAPTSAARLRVLVTGGAVALGLGLLWSRALPLSKPLWTGSFVLVTAGLTTLALALVDFVVDVRGLRRWSRPFVWLGANALGIYIGSEVVRRLLDAPVVTQGSGPRRRKRGCFGMCWNRRSARGPRPHPSCSPSVFWRCGRWLRGFFIDLAPRGRITPR